MLLKKKFFMVICDFEKGSQKQHFQSTLLVGREGSQKITCTLCTVLIMLTILDDALDGQEFVWLSSAVLDALFHGNRSVSIADVNECLFPEVFPCASDEQCTDTVGSFRCDPCLEGCDAVGFQCDTWCHNGATCVINDYDDNDIDCLCTDGFTGSNRGPCHNVPSYFQLSYISNDSHMFAYFAVLNVFIT